MNLLKRISRFFKKIIRHPETLTFTGIMVSAYYIGGGASLAINLLSPTVFIVLALPALIWFIILLMQPMEQTHEAYS